MGSILAEGVGYGRCWAKREATLGRDSQPGLSQRACSLEVVMSNKAGVVEIMEE